MRKWAVVDYGIRGSATALSKEKKRLGWRFPAGLDIKLWLETAEDGRHDETSSLLASIPID